MGTSRSIVCALVLSACGTAAPPRALRASEPEPRAVASLPAPLEPGERVFVRRTVPLRVDDPDGPIVGRAFAGAQLRLVGVESGWAAVQLDERRFGWRHYPIEEGTDLVDFVVLLPLDAVGRETVELEAPELSGRLAAGFHTRLSAAPGGPPFAAIHCGPFRIVDERAGADRLEQQLATYHDGVELIGWADSEIRGTRGPVRCPPRALFAVPGEPPPQEVPEGMVLARREEVARAIGPALRRGAAIHFLVDGADGASCERMELRGDQLVGEREQRADGAVGRTSYGLHRTDTLIELTGPRFDRGERVETVRCARFADVVGVDGERIAVVGADEMGGGRARVHAYHPDDVELWFRTSEACERAAATRNSAPLDAESVVTLPQARGGC
jgi:hypothetical protein